MNQKSVAPLRSGGNRLAAIIVDLSEKLTNREDMSLEYLLKNARILMSAVSHEVRNMAGAALVFHENLSRVEALRGTRILRPLAHSFMAWKSCRRWS